MNLNAFSVFLTVVEEMNFTRAAERLYISQQALSGYIRRLEAHYGDTLSAQADAQADRRGRSTGDLCPPASGVRGRADAAAGGYHEKRFRGADVRHQLSAQRRVFPRYLESVSQHAPEYQRPAA